MKDNEQIDGLYYILKGYLDNLLNIDDVKDVPGYLEDLIQKLSYYKRTFERLVKKNEST